MFLRRGKVDVNEGPRRQGDPCCASVKNILKGKVIPNDIFL